MAKRPLLYWVPIGVIGVECFWFYAGMSAAAFMNSRSITPEFVWMGLTSEPLRWGSIAIILAALPVALFGLVKMRSWARGVALATVLFLAIEFTLNVLFIETTPPRSSGTYGAAALLFIFPNVLSAFILAIWK